MTTELNTFSSLVDICLERVSRPDRLADIISYARMTIREIQTLGMFQQDVVEDQISGVTADPYVWETPARFRAMLTVQYPGVIDEQGKPIYSKYREIGKGQLRHDYYYYRSGDSHVFVGHGGIGGASVAINIAYTEFCRTFRYVADSSARPAIYDGETETWIYAAAYDIDAATRLTARELVSNWVLFNWFDTVLEGTMAKLYKLVNDERSGATFSFFERAKRMIQSGETTAHSPENR